MEPNYILRANEALVAASGEKPSPIKRVVMIISGVLLVGSLVLGENLFAEMTFLARMIFLGLLIWSLYNDNSTVDVPSPIELQFYDDRLVIFRPKVNRSATKKVRQETTTFRYEDITDSDWNKGMGRLNIRGTYHGVYYEYDANGTMGATPTYDRMVRGGLEVIRTKLEPNVDFAAEIESHSPIKVRITNEKG